MFDKCMTRGVEVGAGHWLTIVQIEHEPIPDDLGSAIPASREQAQVAVAFIASVLDERVAQELLAEDLLVLDGSKPVAAADLRELVRHFLPFEVTEVEGANLASLDGAEQPRHVKTAARWYLRGAQAGPGIDGVMFLWFAVEALVGTSKKAPIEDALREAGRDPADQAIGVGKLHGIRSKIVHDKPDSDPPQKEEVRQAFYDLEAMVKTLLRHSLGVDSTWPAHSASQVFLSPWAERIEAAWREPEVYFYDALPASNTEPIDGLAWGRMLPPLQLSAVVKVTGGQEQDANRVRRIVEMALLYFGDPDIGEFLVEIRRFDDEETQADCRDDCLVVSSRIVDPQDPLDALRLVKQIHVFVGRCLLARNGVPSDEAGLFLHGVLTGWIRARFDQEREIPDEYVVVYPLPPNGSQFDVGEHFGAGAAGSDENRRNVEALLGGESPEERAAAKKTFDSRMTQLGEIDTPADLLSLLRQFYAESLTG